MKQIANEDKSSDKSDVSLVHNGHSSQTLQKTSEHAATDQKLLTQLNANNNTTCNKNCDSTAVNTIAAATKSGLHLCFVANANKSCTNSKQCQLGKFTFTIVYKYVCICACKK